MVYITIHIIQTSDYFDCINRPKDLINKAIELGLGGICITDHECLSSHVEVNKIAKSLLESNPDFKIALGNEIYLMINSKVADALCNLKNFVRSDIIINIIGEKVMIFIDGFRMSLTKNIKEKLKPDILEKQAEAIVAFHQVINELVVAFSGEITFEKEQKGNGILDY